MTIEQEMIFDAVVEALRSRSAMDYCFIPGREAAGKPGEALLSRFEWADWIADNKESIMKSAVG